MSLLTIILIVLVIAFFYGGTSYGNSWGPSNPNPGSRGAINNVLYLLAVLLVVYIIYSLFFVGGVHTVGPRL